MSNDFPTGSIPSKEECQKISLFYRAKLDQAMFLEASRKLVPLSHVMAYLRVVGSSLRTSIAQLPDRMSPRLAPESDEETVHQILLREVQSICTEIEELQVSELVEAHLEENAARDPVLRSGKVTHSHQGKDPADISRQKEKAKLAKPLR